MASCFMLPGNSISAGPLGWPIELNDEHFEACTRPAQFLDVAQATSVVNCTTSRGGGTAGEPIWAT